MSGDSASRFLAAENFQLAWSHVAANQGCAGTDGETIAHFAQNADRSLKDLRNAVEKDTYRPLPLRQIWIPKREEGREKKEEKRGELRVPTVRDSFGKLR